MPLTNRHHELAQTIDTYVRDIIASGGGDEQILETMYDYMPLFKELLGTASGDIDILCQQYDGFYRFAKLLEMMAQGIKDGTVKVPGKPRQKRPRKPKPRRNQGH